MADFEQLLKAFMNPDNSVRKQAEETYNKAKESTQGKGMAAQELVKMMRSSQDLSVRSMAAVLLRRLLTKDLIEEEPAWKLFAKDAAAMNYIKQQLLEAVETEQENTVRNKICDTLSVLAGCMLAEDVAWPELVPKLFVWAGTAGPSRKASLSTLATVAEYVGRGLFQGQFVQQVKEVLSVSITADNAMEVRETAVRAAAKFVALLESSQEREYFTPLLGPMLAVVSDALNAGDELVARHTVELLIEVAEADNVAFFKPAIDQVLGAMVQISSVPALDDDTRHLAMELILTVVEAKPGMVRKRMPDLVSQIFQIGLTWMLELDDSSPWTITGTEDVELTSYEFGLECMDRLALKIGGKTLLPIAFAPATGIPLYMQRQDWQARHAALMTISQISEGCSKAIGAQLGQIVEMAIKFFQDPHPRVRYAAINCLGQMASDFSPDFQNEFHATLMPALVAVLDDASPEVAGHGASCVINFAEGAKKDDMLKYSETMLGKLLVLLQGANRHVSEQAITAVAAIADCLEEKFIPYYDHIMPGLKQILATIPGDTKENQSLRGRGMECISVVALAVGKEKFTPDAAEVINLIHQAQENIKADDDAQMGFLHQSWSRIARVMVADFLPYLPHVMPGLLKAVMLDETLQDDDDDDDDDDENIHIRTSALEEKSTACGMICCYVDVLGAGFAPFVEPSTEAMLPLIDHYADDIRIAVAQSLPLCTKSGVEALKAQGQDPKSFTVPYFAKVLTPFLAAIAEEADMEVLQEQLQALGDLFENAGERCLTTEDQKKQVCSVMINILQEILTSREARHAANAADAEDLDEEALEALQADENTEEDVMMMFMTAMAGLIKSHKAEVLGYLEPILQKFLEMIKPDRKAADRKLALLVLDDVYEYGGEGMHGLIPQTFPYFCQYLTDQESSVRQAAAYGIGQLAEQCSMLPLVQQNAKACADALVTVIEGGNARHKKQVHATDNCISALGKYVEFCGSQLGDPTPYLHKWVHMLPVTGDLEEGKVIYNRLCGFMEKNAQAVLGASNENLAQVMKAFAFALETEAVDEALKARIKGVAMNLNQTMGPQVIAACQQLPPDEVAKLQRL